MNRVKGSKQYRMVVVPYRPWRKALFCLLGTAIVCGSVAGAYFFGAWHGAQQLSELQAAKTTLQSQLSDLQAQYADVEQQVTNLRMGSQIDQKANEEVRQEVIALRSQIAELEEDISFYRGLMAPTADKQGLSIGNVNIVANGPRRYQFTMMVQQFAANHSLIKGYLNVTITGYKAGVPMRIPLKDLTDSITAEDIKLRFKYFQNITGELALPDEFEPEGIELVAVATGRNAARVEQKYGWLVHES